MNSDLFFLRADAAQPRRSLVPPSSARVGRGFSLMHGANDAQKTMGIIAGALVTGGYLQSRLRSRLGGAHGAHTAIGLGTLSGGWRIIQTMG